MHEIKEHEREKKFKTTLRRKLADTFVISYDSFTHSETLNDGNAGNHPLSSKGFMWCNVNGGFVSGVWLHTQQNICGSDEMASQLFYYKLE